MKVLAFIVAAALMGLTGASSNSSVGLLKFNGGTGAWRLESAYEKTSAFVDGLTTAPKLALITASAVNSTKGTFDGLNFLDGDMGLQVYYYVSVFSLSNALAMTWDEDPIYSQAIAVATEYYQKGLQVPLGPTA
ncbi:hypothetical protein BBP40_000552 [Aspergillus hancockii]|nr:hypothetical protein BBP40_000552 [Aspergillus hancockii]